MSETRQVGAVAVLGVRSDTSEQRRATYLADLVVGVSLPSLGRFGLGVEVG